jgi:hypothetical protein
MPAFEIIVTILVTTALIFTFLNIVDAYFERKEEERRKEHAEFVKKVRAWSENPTDPTLRWW